jgi:thiol-disulfide isomerase/thioredoxin
MNTTKKTSRLAAVTFIAIVLLLCCTGCKVATGTQVGDKAIDFNLSTLTGENVHLRDLEGKPVMFTFWTTGCGACIYQMPFVQEARDELKDKVTFIEIDIHENSDLVKQCLAYYGFNISVALDSNASTAIAYNIRYTPTNVIVDSGGIIRHIQIGAFTSKEQVLTALSDVK